jgi:hypothetical protein
MANQEFIRKITSLPSDIKIYSYRGHGADVCDPTNHNVITRRVPDGCIYITIEVCGEVTYFNDNREDSFHSKNPITNGILKYPYLFEDELPTKLSIPSTQAKNIIRVRLPGEYYAVSMLSPFAYWYDERNMGYATSGLSEKTKMERSPKASYPKGLYVDDIGRWLPGTPLKQLIKKDIISYFQASVWPTPEKVRECLRDEPDVITPISINDGAESCWRIKNKIEEECGYFRGVSDKDGPDAFLSNTYMMEKFPGIHYNLICRATDTECSGDPVRRRRAESFDENVLRRDVLRDRATKNRIIDFILANHNLDEGFKNILRTKRV